MNRTTGARPVRPARDPLVDLLEEQAPVGEPGQRVVVGLVAELLLEPRQLGERLLELAVLEGDRGLVGERLEEPQVVVGERRALGQPVADQERADDARLAAERGDHRLAQAGPLGLERAPGVKKNACGSVRIRRAIGSSGDVRRPGTIARGSRPSIARRPEGVLADRPRGWRRTSARSARNIIRACSRRATIAESSSGECWRIRPDW